MSSNDEDLVSVIVPIYKVEDYLRECVDSIINQTYKNLEIILVDDGSPDKCGEICEEYARQDDRVTVYHKENGGLSDARNYGTARSHGEYITFVDSDDVIKENFVETLLRLIHKYNADIAIALYSTFRDSPQWGGKSDKSCASIREIMPELLYQRMGNIVAWGKLYKKKLWDKIQFPKGILYEDMATTYKVIFRSKRIVFVNERLYGYRARQDSITKKRATSRNMLHTILVTRQFYKAVTEKYPDFQRPASSIAFSQNRSVYLNFPFSSRNERMQIWAEMKKYRHTVIFDPKARKRERIAALLSYLGADLFHLLFSWLYRKRQMM